MRSAFHTGGGREAARDRAGAGRDRLAAGDAGAVPPAGRRRAGRPARRWPPRPAPGAAPAQAKTRVSSPLRKRWQRTPPVAAALGGVLGERRHLDRRRARCRAARSTSRTTVTTTDDCRVERAEPGHRLAGRRAGRRRCRRRSGPAGRTPSAPKCSSWASVVTKQSVSSPVASSSGADDLVAVLERDHLPLVPAEHLGVDPLDDALAGAEREARAVGGAARSAPAPARRPRAGGTR